jgi:hypothetical protein
MTRVIFTVREWTDDDDGPGWAVFDSTGICKGFSNRWPALLRAFATRADKKREPSEAQVAIALEPGIYPQNTHDDWPDELRDGRVVLVSLEGDPL